MTANTTLDRLQQLLPQLFQPIPVIGDPYLRFQLTPDMPALLSMERVQEALLVANSAISPLPNMPALAIGLMNTRDRVFLVVDLAQVLGLPPLPLNPRNYQVIVLRLSERGNEDNEAEKYLGLAVHKVRGVARFETARLKSVAGECPAALQPYLLGSFQETSFQETNFQKAGAHILVLDTGSIVNAPLLLQNPFVSTKPN